MRLSKVALISEYVEKKTMTKKTKDENKNDGKVK